VKTNLVLETRVWQDRAGFTDTAEETAVEDQH